MRHLLLPGALVCLSAALFAHVPAQAADVRTGQAVEHFLASKHEAQARSARALVARGLEARYAENLEWLKANTRYLPPASMAQSSSQRDGIQANYLVDVAQSLTGLGWSVAGMRSSAQQGRDLTEILGRITRGGFTDDDFVAAADTIVIARATATGQRPTANDGYRSGLRFVVDEVLKGAVRKGDKIVVRQTSGTHSDGSVVTRVDDMGSESPETRNGASILHQL